MRESSIAARTRSVTSAAVAFQSNQSNFERYFFSWDWYQQCLADHSRKAVQHTHKA
jgi:hypothetical protein